MLIKFTFFRLNLYKMNIPLIADDYLAKEFILSIISFGTII
ncbi:hypothetical protein LFUMFP_30026 [Latilactobacillus fuchuensis]|uniref:Uncharacterized protein n=1 Tax=Latilactobacillus fuchuensis TaxID=164393 RepID=A0A2N9DWA4_9LACO|nr:hypothetical protein LFUMFP_30026 [Latilactobacillus fuchuensis]